MTYDIWWVLYLSFLMHTFIRMRLRLPIYVFDDRIRICVMSSLAAGLYNEIMYITV